MYVLASKKHARHGNHVEQKEYFATYKWIFEWGQYLSYAGTIAFSGRKYSIFHTIYFKILFILVCKTELRNILLKDDIVL